MTSTPIRVEPPFGPTDRPREKSPPLGPRVKRFAARLSVKIGIGLLLLVLPFFVLVRTSVWLRDVGAGNAWIPLFGGVLVTALLLAAYGLATVRKLTGKWGLPRYTRRVLAALVAVYAIHGVVYLSAGNAKSEDVRSGYVAVHPLLRMATATLVLADRDLVVTDASRTLADYERMGLPPNEASLHFEQADGWVHAVDLRTLGRNRWRNGFMSLYFWAMGFHTLRHRGTADHLHVSIAA